MRLVPGAKIDAPARAVAKRALRRIMRRWVPERRDLEPSRWGLARDTAGTLELAGTKLDDLIARFGSPIHVVDAARLAADAARFVGARGCEAFASYKTNPVPGVLRRLHDAGLGADAASPYELWLALRLGLDPSRVIYGGPAKSPESIATALGRRVALVNLNDRGEIAGVAETARSLGVRPAIGMRVVPPGFMRGQFGERIDDGSAMAAFRDAHEHTELRVAALHAHFNGSIATSADLDRFLGGILAFTDELYRELGVELEILDVGGNLVCPTVSGTSGRARRLAMTFGVDPVPRSPESVLSIEAYTAGVIERIERHYAARGRRAPRVFLEPGRALMTSAQMLLTRVIATRERDDAGMDLAVLDASINVADPLRSEVHQLFPVVERRSAHRRRYRLMGPTCTLGDQLYAAWTLPELARGDAIAIMDTGAYFVPASSAFSFPRPGVVVLERGEASVLRDAETFEDIVARDHDRALGR